MKRVFSNSHDVMHAFANLSDAERFTRDGRSSNVYFENGSIYSYGRHFTLAKFVMVKKRAVLCITTNGYSATTSKHKSQLRGAVSHLERVFMPDAGSLENSIYGWRRQLESACAKLQSARKPEKYLSEIGSIGAEIATYYKTFGGRVPAELKRLMNVSGSEQYAKVLASARVAEIRKAKAAKIASDKRDAELAEKFHTFDGVDSCYPSNGESLLRYNAEKRRIETSQRVELPVTYAKQLWQMIDYGRRNADFDTLKGFSVLDRFPVQSFNAESIRIGCHSIALREVDRIANQLSWV